jgi:hypothetical protein
MKLAYNTIEAAQALGLSEAALNRLVSEGKIVGRYVAMEYVISADELTQFAEREFGPQKYTGGTRPVDVEE